MIIILILSSPLSQPTGRKRTHPSITRQRSLPHTVGEFDDHSISGVVSAGETDRAKSDPVVQTRLGRRKRSRENSTNSSHLYPCLRCQRQQQHSDHPGQCSAAGANPPTTDPASPETHPPATSLDHPANDPDHETSQAYRSA